MPTLTSPANGATTDASPTLQWSNESGSGATSYDVLFVQKGVSCDFTGASPDNLNTNSQAKAAPLTAQGGLRHA